MVSGAIKEASRWTEQFTELGRYIVYDESKIKDLKQWILVMFTGATLRGL
jgi:hypothetical protein